MLGEFLFSLPWFITIMLQLNGLFRTFPSGCVECQIFSIWHTKHQKQTIMRCVKCQKNLAFATVQSHLLNGTEGNVIWFLLFFIHLSLSSQIKCLFLSSLWSTYSLLHPLHSYRLLCSPLFPFALFSSHSWATTNFLSTISQIPSSLIYKISFTVFFFPRFFALSSLFYLIHQSYLVQFSYSFLFFLF